MPWSVLGPAWVLWLEPCSQGGPEDAEISCLPYPAPANLSWRLANPLETLPGAEIRALVSSPLPDFPGAKCREASRPVSLSHSLQGTQPLLAPLPLTSCLRTCCFSHPPGSPTSHLCTGSSSRLSQLCPSWLASTLTQVCSKPTSSGIMAAAQSRPTLCSQTDEGSFLAYLYSLPPPLCHKNYNGLTAWSRNLSAPANSVLSPLSRIGCPADAIKWAWVPQRHVGMGRSSFSQVSSPGHAG